MAKVLRVALVAGEASGDILGASLMQALKAVRPDIEFIGVGGPRMQAEGLHSYFPMERLAVMGLFEVLGRLPELLLRREQLIRTLIKAQPDVYIGIDAPDFNLGIELRLRRAGIRTVHYVSPTVWAWRQERVLKTRQACDLMLTLFPFEAQFYEAQDVPVRFVGHPLADQIPLQTDRGAARAALDLTAEETIIALLPGSRAGELARLGPLFLEAAEHLLALHSGALRFVVPCASPERRGQLEKMLSHTRRDLPVMLLDGRSHEVLAACDAVLIASGTATLEALLYKRPMVVAYRLAPLTYQVARHLVKTPFFSLPNLLAGRALVPELLQDLATPEALAEALMPLLEMSREQTECFDAIHRSLRRDASRQAAESVLELVECA